MGGDALRPGMSGVALAMCHRLSGLSIYGLNGYEREMICSMYGAFMMLIST